MVRPSTMFYHRFSLLMGSSPSFGSNIYDSRPVQACFHCGFNFLYLNLAIYINSLVRSTKSTWSRQLPLFKSIRFQGLFHSPPGVLFTFPSWYQFTIDLEYYLALESGLPRFNPDYTCPNLLRNKQIQSKIYYNTGL